MSTVIGSFDDDVDDVAGILPDVYVKPSTWDFFCENNDYREVIYLILYYVNCSCLLGLITLNVCATASFQPLEIDILVYIITQAGLAELIITLYSYDHNVGQADRPI